MPQSDRLQILSPEEYELLWGVPRFSQYDRDLFFTLAAPERHTLERLRTYPPKLISCCSSVTFVPGSGFSELRCRVSATISSISTVAIWTTPSLLTLMFRITLANARWCSFSSRGRFLYGRFEVTLQATNVPGQVTGFFLHRDSPRQEIDVEITGNRPCRLLAKVFYNPGSEGAKFNYGYRGTPVSIPLGFDASEVSHRFAIEMDLCEIRWFVDDKPIHRRATWSPTPIPHLPMKLHVNALPTRSRELAGRLALRAVPASAIVRRIAVDAFNADRQSPLALVS